MWRCPCILDLFISYLWNESAYPNLFGGRDLETEIPQNPYSFLLGPVNRLRKTLNVDNLTKEIFNLGSLKLNTEWCTTLMVGSNIDNMIVKVVATTWIWGFTKIKMKLLGTFSTVQRVWFVFIEFTVKHKIRAFIQCK